MYNLHEINHTIPISLSSSCLQVAIKLSSSIQLKEYSQSRPQPAFSVWLINDLLSSSGPGPFQVHTNSVHSVLFKDQRPEPLNLWSVTSNPIPLILSFRMTFSVTLWMIFRIHNRGFQGGIQGGLGGTWRGISKGTWRGTF